MLDFYVKTRIRFSLRDQRLFEITEVEVMRVDCILVKGKARNKHCPVNERKSRFTHLSLKFYSVSVLAAENYVSFKVTGILSGKLHYH